MLSISILFLPFFACSSKPSLMILIGLLYFLLLILCLILLFGTKPVVTAAFCSTMYMTDLIINTINFSFIHVL